MLSSNCTEPVYQFIWEYVTTNERLPSRQQIADGLGLDKEQVSACVYGLRQQGRLSATTLLPTAYTAWWRENVRREHRWQIKPLIPLRRLQEKQLPLPLIES